jgi:hypothetical protein
LQEERAETVPDRASKAVGLGVDGEWQSANGELLPSDAAPREASPTNDLHALTLPLPAT